MMRHIVPGVLLLLALLPGGCRGVRHDVRFHHFLADLRNVTVFHDSLYKQGVRDTYLLGRIASRIGDIVVNYPEYVSDSLDSAHLAQHPGGAVEQCLPRERDPMWNLVEAYRRRLGSEVLLVRLHLDLCGGEFGGAQLRVSVPPGARPSSITPIRAHQARVEARFFVRRSAAPPQAAVEITGRLPPRMLRIPVEFAEPVWNAYLLAPADGRLDSLRAFYVVDISRSMLFERQGADPAWLWRQLEEEPHVNNGIGSNPSDICGFDAKACRTRAEVVRHPGADVTRHDSLLRELHHIVGVNATRRWSIVVHLTDGVVSPGGKLTDTPGAALMNSMLRGFSQSCESLWQDSGGVLYVPVLLTPNAGAKSEMARKPWDSFWEAFVQYTTSYDELQRVDATGTTKFGDPDTLWGAIKRAINASENGCFGAWSRSVTARMTGEGGVAFDRDVVEPQGDTSLVITHYEFLASFQPLLMASREGRRLLLKNRERVNGRPTELMPIEDATGRWLSVRHRWPWSRIIAVSARSGGRWTGPASAELAGVAADTSVEALPLRCVSRTRKEFALPSVAQQIAAVNIGKVRAYAIIETPGGEDHFVRSEQTIVWLDGWAVVLLVALTLVVAAMVLVSASFKGRFEQFERQTLERLRGRTPTRRFRIRRWAQRVWRLSRRSKGLAHSLSVVATSIVALVVPRSSPLVFAGSAFVTAGSFVVFAILLTRSAGLMGNTPRLVSWQRASTVAFGVAFAAFAGCLFFPALIAQMGAVVTGVVVLICVAFFVAAGVFLP